jgi:Ca2+-transporting ATPase
LAVNFEFAKIRGLGAEEAARRLQAEGYNELPSQKKGNFLSTLLGILHQPMLALLLVAGIVYLFLGEGKDALLLLLFVFVVIGITFYQEHKTERALDALKNLSSPRALVIRDGQQLRIAGREVVREDMIVLHEGDRVPADATLIFCSNLTIDESLLTGESLPVRKKASHGQDRPAEPGGDDHPFVYSGTLIVSGQGVAKVTAVGGATQMGKIGHALENIQEEGTLLQKETGRLVRNFAVGGIILCSLVVIIYGLVFGNWLNGFLAGLSLSMAMLPEEFAVVMLIFLSLGAWRISRRQVLTRRLPVIETLGAATVLCVDKTGTLTMNHLELNILDKEDGQLNISAGEKNLPEEYHPLLEFSFLASQKDPFDPIEREIKRGTDLFLSGTEHIHHNWKLVREYPLSQELMALSHVWESPDRQQYIVAAKGAPEAIADLCHLDELAKTKLYERIAKLAKDGLRMLGVAKATFRKTNLPSEQHVFNFQFLGLIGFIDPVRKSVPAALHDCYSAGIRVIMITGDYPGTAQHVARLIGLKNPEKFITGQELNKMSSEQLKEKIKTNNIFARMVPEQKLRLVDALKANGEIVAMTGDGVNDAPALKASHIGIAMGERGTDVARESASLVLLNDDFSSIVEAARMGRRIFDNLKRAIAYIFSVHIPIAGLALLPVIFRMPLILLPAHIAFLELIIDPACSTVFEAEPEEAGIMQRPPRRLAEPLFNRRTMFISLLQGLSVLLMVFLVFIFSLWIGQSEAESRTITFTTLVIANLAMIVTNLSWSRSMTGIWFSGNKALWWITGGTLISFFLLLCVPFLREIFRFSVLGPGDAIIAFSIGLFSVLWFEIIKKMKYVG